MKTKLHTNLVGKQCRLDAQCREPGLCEIVAVFIADEDRQPSVAVRPLDRFGRPITGGRIYIAFLTTITLE